MPGEPHTPKPTDICEECGNGLVHITPSLDAAALPPVAPDLHVETVWLDALKDIYESARRFDGVCRWCDAPPPDDEMDHDVACPAAKAGYALDLPGYHDWQTVARRLRADKGGGTPPKCDPPTTHRYSRIGSTDTLRCYRCGNERPG